MTARLARDGGQVRSFGRVNWRGLWVLYAQKGVLRFWRFGLETIAGPVVSSCIFVTVFVLALDGSQPMSPDLTLAQFVVPGIVMFTLAHSAFDTAAIMIIHDKQESIIEDVLMAPLTPLEMLLGYALGAATSALITGGLLLAILSAFVALPFTNILLACAVAFGGVILFALVGVLVGLWAERWDHFSAAETFLVMPLGLLSGTFFSIERVPAGYDWLLLGNPMFHAINGFRSGITGHSDAAVWTGGLMILVLSLGFGLLAWRLLVRGYRIKA